MPPVAPQGLIGAARHQLGLSFSRYSDRTLEHTVRCGSRCRRFQGVSLAKQEVVAL